MTLTEILTHYPEPTPEQQEAIAAAEAALNAAKAAEAAGLAELQRISQLYAEAQKQYQASKAAKHRAEYNLEAALIPVTARNNALANVQATHRPGETVVFSPAFEYVDGRKTKVAPAGFSTLHGTGTKRREVCAAGEMGAYVNNVGPGKWQEARSSFRAGRVWHEVTE